MWNAVLLVTYYHNHITQGPFLWGSYSFKAVLYVKVGLGELLCSERVLDNVKFISEWWYSLIIGGFFLGVTTCRQNPLTLFYMHLSLSLSTHTHMPRGGTWYQGGREKITLSFRKKVVDGLMIRNPPKSFKVPRQVCTDNSKGWKMKQ